MSPLRSQPYRLFFPLGALLGGVGVSHWLFYALGWQESYSGRIHALIQIQAFLMAFACGFLMMMVPRRTQTDPATSGELVAVSLGLLITTGAALRNQWLLAEAGFVLVLITLVRFAVRRFRSGAAGRRPPDAFVLIPIGLLHGLVGAVLIALPQVGIGGVAFVEIGRWCIQEGLFLCLALGIGHMFLPLISGYDPPLDADGGAASARRRWVHALSGLAILVSFPLQWWLLGTAGGVVALRVAYGLRCAVVTAHLVFGLRAYRWPRVPGLHRRLVWLSFWMLPLGLGLVVAVPVYKVALLHVLFVGGFSLMVFGVGCHVILSHSDHAELAAGRPWPVIAFGSLALFAMLTRVTADFLATYMLHLGIAAALWLVGLVVWVGFLVPKAAAGRSATE